MASNKAAKKASEKASEKVLEEAFKVSQMQKIAKKIRNVFENSRLHKEELKTIATQEIKRLGTDGDVGSDSNSECGSDDTTPSVSLLQEPDLVDSQSDNDDEDDDTYNSELSEGTAAEIAQLKKRLNNKTKTKTKTKNDNAAKEEETDENEEYMLNSLKNVTPKPHAKKSMRGIKRSFIDSPAASSIDTPSKPSTNKKVKTSKLAKEEEEEDDDDDDDRKVKTTKKAEMMSKKKNMGSRVDKTKKNSKRV